MYVHTSYPSVHSPTKRQRMSTWIRSLNEAVADIEVATAVSTTSATATTPTSASSVSSNDVAAATAISPPSLPTTSTFELSASSLHRIAQHSFLPAPVVRMLQWQHDQRQLHHATQRPEPLSVAYPIHGRVDENGWCIVISYSMLFVWHVTLDPPSRSSSSPDCFCFSLPPPSSSSLSSNGGSTSDVLAIFSTDADRVHVLPSSMPTQPVVLFVTYDGTLVACHTELDEQQHVRQPIVHTSSALLRLSSDSAAVANSSIATSTTSSPLSPPPVLFEYCTRATVLQVENRLQSFALVVGTSTGRLHALFYASAQEVLALTPHVIESGIVQQSSLLSRLGSSLYRMLFAATTSATSSVTSSSTTSTTATSLSNGGAYTHAQLAGPAVSLLPYSRATDSGVFLLTPRSLSMWTLSQQRQDMLWASSFDELAASALGGVQPTFHDMYATPSELYLLAHVPSRGGSASAAWYVVVCSFDLQRPVPVLFSRLLQLADTSAPFRSTIVSSSASSASSTSSLPRSLRIQVATQMSDSVIYVWSSTALTMLASSCVVLPSSTSSASPTAFNSRSTRDVSRSPHRNRDDDGDDSDNIDGNADATDAGSLDASFLIVSAPPSITYTFPQHLVLGAGVPLADHVSWLAATGRAPSLLAATHFAVAQETTVPLLLLTDTDGIVAAHLKPSNARLALQHTGDLSATLLAHDRQSSSQSSSASSASSTTVRTHADRIVDLRFALRSALHLFLHGQLPAADWRLRGCIERGILPTPVDAKRSLGAIVRSSPSSSSASSSVSSAVFSLACVELCSELMNTLTSAPVDAFAALPTSHAHAHARQQASEQVQAELREKASRLDALVRLLVDYGFWAHVSVPHRSTLLAHAEYVQFVSVVFEWWCAAPLVLASNPKLHVLHSLHSLLVRGGEESGGGGSAATSAPSHAELRFWEQHQLARNDVLRELFTTLRQVAGGGSGGGGAAPTTLMAAAFSRVSDVAGLFETLHASSMRQLLQWGKSASSTPAPVDYATLHRLVVVSTLLEFAFVSGQQQRLRGESTTDQYMQLMASPCADAAAASSSSAAAAPDRLLGALTHLLPAPWTFMPRARSFVVEFVGHLVRTLVSVHASSTSSSTSLSTFSPASGSLARYVDTLAHSAYRMCEHTLYEFRGYRADVDSVYRVWLDRDALSDAQQTELRGALFQVGLAYVKERAQLFAQLKDAFSLSAAAAAAGASSSSSSSSAAPTLVGLPRDALFHFCAEFGAFNEALELADEEPTQGDSTTRRGRLLHFLHRFGRPFADTMFAHYHALARTCVLMQFHEPLEYESWLAAFLADKPHLRWLHELRCAQLAASARTLADVTRSVSMPIRQQQRSQSVAAADDDQSMLAPYGWIQYRTLVSVRKLTLLAVGGNASNNPVVANEVAVADRTLRYLSAHEDVHGAQQDGPVLEPVQLFDALLKAVQEAPEEAGAEAMPSHAARTLRDTVRTERNVRRCANAIRLVTEWFPESFAHEQADKWVQRVLRVALEADVSCGLFRSGSNGGGAGAAEAALIADARSRSHVYRLRCAVHSLATTTTMDATMLVRAFARVMEEEDRDANAAAKANAIASTAFDATTRQRATLVWTSAERDLHAHAHA